jgi:Mor family transcriptional regulator
MDNAQRLCKHFGGDRIYIPRCDALDLARRNRNIVTAYNNGVSVWQLASDHVLSDRQIWTILKKTDMSESAQTSLF